MGIKLEVAAEKAPEPKETTKKLTYTNANLPFPRDGRFAKYLKKWQTTFLAGIIEWAATLEEPFGSNSHPDLPTTVQDTWNRVFPDLRNESENPAVLSMVSTPSIHDHMLNVARRQELASGTGAAGLGKPR
jgi:hypothetical protein